MLSFLLLQPKYKVTLWQTNKTSDQATEASANGTAGKAQISEGRMCIELYFWIIPRDVASGFWGICFGLCGVLQNLHEYNKYHLIEIHTRDKGESIHK